LPSSLSRRITPRSWPIGTIRTPEYTSRNAAASIERLLLTGLNAVERPRDHHIQGDHNDQTRDSEPEQSLSRNDVGGGWCRVALCYQSVHDYDVAEDGDDRHGRNASPAVMLALRIDQ
jgi:hypothetical protein